MLSDAELRGCLYLLTTESRDVRRAANARINAHLATFPPGERGAEVLRVARLGELLPERGESGNGAAEVDGPPTWVE